MFLVASDNIDCRLKVFASLFFTFHLVPYTLLCPAIFLLRSEVIWQGDRSCNNGITSHTEMRRRSSIRTLW